MRKESDHLTRHGRRSKTCRQHTIGDDTHGKPPTLETSHLAHAQVADEVIASSGVTFQLWRLYQHAWLVCLVFPLVALLREPISLGHLTLGLLALVGFATGYTWLMWPHPVSQEARIRARARFSFVLFGTLGAV